MQIELHDNNQVYSKYRKIFTVRNIFFQIPRSIYRKRAFIHSDTLLKGCR